MTFARSYIRGKGHENKTGIYSLNHTERQIRDSLSKLSELALSTDHAFKEYLQEQRMESLEKMSSGISHDLRSCLMALEGNLHVLEKEQLSKGARDRLETVRNILEQIEGIASRLDPLGMSQSLKHISRKEQDVNIQLLDLSTELEQVLNSLKPTLPDGLIIHFSTPKRPLPVSLAQGDTWRILSNLVSNACEAMNGKGDLLISTSFQTVTSRYCRLHGNAYPGDFAVLRVSDHGCGIPEQMMERIFEPLVTTKSPAGMNTSHGWGLSIVYALVRRRKGWIHVTSTVGEGSTFEIFLPIAAPTNPD